MFISLKGEMIQLQRLLEFYKWNASHINMDKCHELKEKGLLQMKKHVEYPLYILNYTSKAQFKQKWCKELIHSRGLVVAEDGEIIARPLPKFFNHYEITGELQEQPYELFKKMDGSLVIMFHYKGNRIFCTRGSFCSDQALRAEQIFKKKYMDEDVNKECTYCFEVIYPQNKIVVDYGVVEDIFLISIIHTKTGKNVNINQAGFNTVEKIATNGICYSEWIQHNVVNEEGYVMRFITENLRVKIKFDNYVEKHKGKHFNIKQIKQSMKKMKTINLDTIPDEYYDEVKAIMTEMDNQFMRKENKVLKEYLQIGKQNPTTSDMIEAIKHSQYSKIMFALHTNKPYDMLIWKSL